MGFIHFLDQTTYIIVNKPSNKYLKRFIKASTYYKSVMCPSVCHFLANFLLHAVFASYTFFGTVDYFTVLYCIVCVLSMVKFINILYYKLATIAVIWVHKVIFIDLIPQCFRGVFKKKCKFCDIE